MHYAFRYRPLPYFLAVFTTTTVCWMAAAWISRGENGAGGLALALLLIGLMSPWLISRWLIRRSGDPVIRSEHRQRLLSVRRIRPLELLAASLLMPASVVLAIVLTVPYGGSWEQLRLAEGFSFAVGAVPTLLLLLLAATFEELGWRGYAFDALQQRFRMPVAMVLFGVLWSLWHLPLILVEGSYQHGLVAESPLYALNFFVSIVPMGVIISWVCLRHGKSVLAAILFHFVINLSQEALDISQATKCAQTVVLTAVALVVLRRAQPVEAFAGDEATDNRSIATDARPRRAATSWSARYVVMVLTVILAGQLVGVAGWTHTWHAGSAATELLVGGIAMQSAWACLLLWALLRPGLRMAVLGASAVAMLVGNTLHAVAGHLDGSLGGAEILVNTLAGCALVGLVIGAAWIAQRLEQGRHPSCPKIPIPYAASRQS